jgi:hypothetical protein
MVRLLGLQLQLNFTSIAFDPNVSAYTRAILSLPPLTPPSPSSTASTQDEIADALERIIAGPEKKGAVMTEKKKRLVAYHESGHALVGALMPEYDPVTKISIVPRGAAGGLTFFAPSEERLESGLYSR